MTVNHLMKAGRRPARRTAAAVGAAGLLLTLAACSHSSKSSASVSSVNPTNAATATASPPAASSSASGKPGGSAAPSPSKSGATGSAPSGGVEAPSTPAAAKQCELTTAADVSAAFGGKVSQQTVSTSGIGSPLCNFVLNSSSAGASVNVTVSTHAPVTAQTFANTKADAIKSGSSSVTGVGDNAYYTSSVNTLQFIRHQTGGYVQVQTMHGTGPTINANAVRAGAITLGKSIVAAL